MNELLAVGALIAFVVFLALLARIGSNYGKTLSRLERTTERIEAAAEIVAADLAQSQQRADKVTDGAPGEAADAGAQSEKPNDG